MYIIKKEFSCTVKKRLPATLRTQFSGTVKAKGTKGKQTTTTDDDNIDEFDAQFTICDYFLSLEVNCKSTLEPEYLTIGLKNTPILSNV